jgi:carboxyl-terminal processing protease
MKPTEPRAEPEADDMRKLATRGLLLGLLLGLLVVTSGAIPRAGSAGIYRSLGTFSEVLSLVRNSYVDEVDENRLFSGAFAGITGALDPASDYIPPDRLSAFRAHLSKPGAGVGITLTRRMGYASISAVLPDSPASEAELTTGAVVEAIAGRSTRGMALWEADVLLRGAVGNTVDHSLLRLGKAY